MGKKRKFSAAESIPKSSIEVVVEDVTTHPMCLHGPTLLFSTEKGKYFGCASCRDKKECTLHIDEEDWKKEGVRKRNEKYYNLIPKLDKNTAWKNFNEVKTRHASDRAYCNTCKELFNISQTKKHRGDHRVTTPLTEEQLRNPSTWLPTLENDYREAQYLFTKKAVSTVLGILKNNKIRDTGLCIVMDPPFGGRVEPLVHTIKELSATYNKLCETEGILPVIWAFPYFSEPYIRNMIPDIKMHDYQVDYQNHKKFQNSKGGRKQGSPVRFYTNLPFATIDLSNDSNYKYCNKCKYWVGKSNVHCNKCKECASKDGTTYVHCNLCNRCVKPTYEHCNTCNRCSQVGHKCGILVESQSCYNCHEKGHKQLECPQKEIEKKKLKST
ncbi:rRNA N6-adenosine-methyltransferase ZCCHC4 isoform X2 [Pieris rapae]|uniref:rRNA N6-adenosine-methyltransferase ZCCHC4 isoform X2 n=1 Tax=Pieris rapae TaxID=64459 RepID=UPI001E280802|nr:rRNA N6-adenosine-methyltransferase ZCCHC4 isoform X2 [Pieris rapae]